MCERVIETYEEFVPALDECGFMLFSGSTPLLKLSDLTRGDAWHTEDERTDPWEWKRLLIERRDGAYAKVRGGQNMLISKAWHSALIAALSPGMTTAERYERGEAGAEEMKLCRLFEERPVWSRHELTRETGFKKSALERALNALQQSFVITASAEVQRVTDGFRPVGWRSMEYTRLDVWSPEACDEAAGLDRDEAKRRVLTRALENSPSADERAVRRFFGW